MSISVIDNAISALCQDLAKFETSPTHWPSLTEEDHIFESVVCICSSQMVFEAAEAIAKHLKNDGLLKIPSKKVGSSNLEHNISTSLSFSCEYKTSDGEIREFKPRFKNRLARFISANIILIAQQKFSFVECMQNSTSPVEARAKLILAIQGFGPKQSSLFLRRVGYSSDLAVLDVHILDYLRLSNKGKSISINVSKLQQYELAEQMFVQHTNKFGHPLGRIDLATWLTMRVAKKEMDLCLL